MSKGKTISINKALAACAAICTVAAGLTGHLLSAGETLPPWARNPALILESLLALAMFLGTTVLFGRSQPGTGPTGKPHEGTNPEKENPA